DGQRFAPVDMKRHVTHGFDHAFGGVEAYCQALYLHDFVGIHASHRVHLSCLGSSASRNPSPNRLKPSTARKIADPGKMDIHGAWVMKFLAVFSIEPHDGLGGCRPRPKKDRLASAMMAVAIVIVACTISGGMMLGRMWRRTMRASDAPRARELCT